MKKMALHAEMLEYLRSAFISTGKMLRVQDGEQVSGLMLTIMTC